MKNKLRKLAVIVGLTAGFLVGAGLMSAFTIERPPDLAPPDLAPPESVHQEVAETRSAWLFAVTIEDPGDSDVPGEYARRRFFPVIGFSESPLGSGNLVAVVADPSAAAGVRFATDLPGLDGFMWNGTAPAPPAFVVDSGGDGDGDSGGDGDGDQ